MTDHIQFTVNGHAARTTVSPSTPLLYVLRNDLQLRGTRHGCGEGDCGACTVLVDGQPMTACNTSIDAIAGKAIETIENLTASEPPHRLISAVLDEQAGQCGYCLPGILMQAKALLTKTPKPNREQIVQALDSNLCRCGAHNRIVRAIETAAMAGNNDDR